MSQQKSSPDTGASQVRGVLFLSLAQACLNLKFYIDDDLKTFIADIRPESWYSLSLLKRLLQFVTARYADSAPILEQIGIEMMKIRPDAGPGTNIITCGMDFLRYQTSSEGFHSVIQGPPEEIGEFTLIKLDEINGQAQIRSSTPFPRNLERGILLGGLGLAGDLRNITVSNAENPDIFHIRFAPASLRAAKTMQTASAADVLDADQIPDNLSLSGAELQQLFWRCKELERELKRQQSFWQVTNQTLSQTLVDLRAKDLGLEQANRELSQAYASSEKLKEAIVDVALDAIVTIDEANRIVEYNPSAERIFGHSRRSVLGRPLAEVLIPEHLRAKHHRGMQRYITSGISKILGRRVEVEALHADGHTFPVELTITEVVLPGQRLFSAYLRDLSAKKATENELRRQREELYQREKLSALGSILASVAHELNNPLSVVVARAIMLETKNLEPENAAAVHKIRTAAERCTSIVKSFLAMARKQSPKRAPVRLNDVIAEALTLTEYSLRTADIEVIQQLQADLPEVIGDDSQLNQVITNLIINAHDAVLDQPPPRRLTLTSRHNTGENMITVAVEDNGPGVPEDIRSKIFEPFFTTKKIGHGTGIGLSMCLGLVSAHAGTLQVEPAAGGGACFIIRLPVQAGAVAAPAAAAAEPALKDARSGHVLVIDDESDVGEILSDILTWGGHKATVATSGNAALELISQYHRHYDVILCDMHMPDLNGPDFFRALETEYPALCQRTAFITGDALGARARQFFQQVDRPALEKPFQPDDILRLVASIMLSQQTAANR